MSQAKMNAFLEFFKNEMQNPPPVTDFFRIPPNLPPDWQSFFEHVLRYCQAVCGDTPNHERVAWEKRQWMMEDDGLDEFDMLVSAVRIKEQGNDEFRKGDFAKALSTYITSLRIFPCPDTMNNLAACALKENRYQLAEEHTTKALDMGLMTNPRTKAKALYRRSQARRYLGKFEEALDDIRAASSLHPTDGGIQDAGVELTKLAESIKSSQELEAYIAAQAQPPPPIPIREALAFAALANHSAIKVPGSIDLRKTQAPTF